jgi:hypothetical protein
VRERLGWAALLPKAKHGAHSPSVSSTVRKLRVTASPHPTRQPDVRLQARLEAGDAVVSDHRAKRRRDRLALGHVEIRPESGGTGDQAQVRDVPRQNRIRRVRLSPLERCVEERLPLQRQTLIRGTFVTVDKLEEYPGAIRLRAEQIRISTPLARANAPSR